MVQMARSGDRSELIVMAAFARIHALALAVATGCMTALALWGSTALLLIKGALPGYHIGTHLALMSNYLPGYAVTWHGSIFGMMYGFVAGFVLGAIVAVAWNLSHFVYLMLVTQRSSVSTEL